MTTPEIIKQIIEESNHTSSTKILANRHVDYLASILSIEEKNHELIETVTREKYFFDILYVSDEVIFYLVFADEEWCDKYPVRFIYKNDKDNWVSCATVAPTMDAAYLVYLENKQKARGFADFALKMLDIKLDD